MIPGRGVVVALGLALAGCATAPDAPLPPNPGPFDGAVRIPVGEVVLSGTLYAAKGHQPKATLVWLLVVPGLPEPSSTAIEAVRSAGCNVFHLHYRDAWGAPGDFGAAQAQADAHAALAYLQQPDVARYYRVDPDALTLLIHPGGHALAAAEYECDSMTNI